MPLFSVLVPWENMLKSTKHRPCVNALGYAGVFYLQHNSSHILSQSRLHVEEDILQLVFGETIPGFDTVYKCIPVLELCPPQTAARHYLLAQMAPTVLYRIRLTGPRTLFPQVCPEFLLFCTRISENPATGEELPWVLKAIVLPPAHARNSMGQGSLVGLG